MARRNRNSQFADSDVQMMETDIMRFLAIIALCLAIIFAIVSGASAAEETKQQQNVTTTSHTNSKVTKEKEVELAEVVKPQKLEQTAKIEPKVEVNNEAQIEVKEETQKQPEQVEAPVVAEQSEKKGYQLSFASDAVFSQLVNQQYIKLYKFSKGVDYHWNGGWKLANKPQKYYQLHVETLPNNYQQQVLAGDEIGVVLPTNTQTDIQQVISKYQSGLLVIGQMAKVTRKPLS